MTPGRPVRELALLALLAGAGLSALLPPNPVGALLVVGAVLALPGALLLDRLGVQGAVPRVAVAAALSLGLQTLATLLMVWTGRWHPGALAALLWGASAVALLLRVLTPHRTRAAEDPARP